MSPETDGSRLAAAGPAMKQLLAWTGSAASTITSEAVMAMAEKFNTGQQVLADPQRAWSYASQRAHLWVTKREVRRPKLRSPVAINYLTYLREILQPAIGSQQSCAISSLPRSGTAFGRSSRPSRGAPTPASRPGASSVASFRVLRSAAPWRHLPALNAPRTTCYNRVIRWRKPASGTDDGRP